jgi:exodeoxyribonuclease V alpha subunit
LLVTANDYGLDLFNGDTGVVVRDGDELRAVVAGVREHRRFATSRLGDIETLHAMTVHKSQGSQAREVTVLLPPEDSPLLTRELFYTAVTRAEERVRVVGSEAAVRAAVATRAQRATGLQLRLAGD